MRRRQLIGRETALAGGLALTLPSRGQSPWPDRPLRLVVPFPAGGSIEVMGRLFAQRLGEQLAQPVAVENKAGAAGAIGSAELPSNRRCASKRHSNGKPRPRGARSDVQTRA